MGKIWIYIYQLIFIIYIIILGLISMHNIYTSKLLKSMFYINIILACLFSIYDIIYIIFAQNIKILFYLKNVFSYSLVIIFILNNFIIFINGFNRINYGSYIKNCPFTFNTNITTFNQSIYGKRICELYNINNNSRYKYQYICSYNASEDFKYDKTKDGFNKIVCISKIHNIDGNDIIREFNLVYNNKDKNESNLFYCSRIDEPKKNEYIKDEYCNKEKDFYYSLIEFLLFLTHILLLCQDKIHKNLEKEISNIEPIMIIPLWQHFNINEIFGNEDCDTDVDESNSNNISFDEEEDKNIIIENHLVYNVSVNIKNYFKKEEKEKLK